jgi:hypothetical protein
MLKTVKGRLEIRLHYRVIESPAKETLYVEHAGKFS